MLPLRKIEWELIILKTQPDVLSGLISSFASSSSIFECWEHLRTYMNSFGFDRLLFASKPYADATNFHNLFGTFVLSSYGPVIDQVFVKDRGFTDDVTTKFLLENTGAVSWQLSRDKFLDGKMSKGEEQIHLATRQLGLIAGFSYSSPRSVERHLSGFGLCFQQGYEQEHVDQVWEDNRGSILPALDVFSIVARTYLSATSSELLDDDEEQIILLVLAGKTNSEISELLNLHRRTTEQKMRKLRARLEVETTTQAVAKLMKQGQIA